MDLVTTAKQYLGIDYNERMKLMKYYNENCYPYVGRDRRYKIQPHDEWCAMFTSVIAHKCGLTSDSFPFEVSVYYQVKLAKERGLYFTDSSLAKPNDLIIFDWKANGTYDHVGFVVSNSKGVIKTIEGNKDRTVAYREISEHSRVIRGFIDVNYNECDNETNRINNLVLFTLQGKYGNGLERARRLGKDYKAVQAVINSMDS